MDCWTNLKLFEEQSTDFSEPNPFFIRCGKLEDSAWGHRPNIQDYLKLNVSRLSPSFNLLISVTMSFTINTVF